MPGVPPPPPLPGMGRGTGGPPPPPMPGGLPSKKQTKGAGRGALLSSIEGGARLKKVGVVNDRSAPIIENKSSSISAAPVGSAPPVPGMAKRPAAPSLAPPPAPNRGRSNSAESMGGSSAGPPQLGGLFAGGMPKLRKAGGIDTGAEQSQSPYLSDPETSRSSAPRPPMGMAPRPPSGSAPRIPGSAPPRPPGPAPAGPVTNLTAPMMPSVAQLRNNLRPMSSASVSSLDISSKPKPAPPPIGKKPPLPPTSRKPSGLAAPPSASTPIPQNAPPLPPGSAPRPPPLRSTPPPPPSIPPSSSNGTPSLAEQAARNVFGRNTSSPAAAPPLPPSSAPSPPSRKQDSDDEYDPYKYTSPTPTPPRLPPSAPPSRPVVAASVPSLPPLPPSAPPSRTPTQSSTNNGQMRSMLDVTSAMSSRLANSNPSSYTLTNGSGTTSAPTGPPSRGSISHGNGNGTGAGVVKIHDLRWRFQDDGTLPKPREWKGSTSKRYRAGRVSSVPLNLSNYD